MLGPEPRIGTGPWVQRSYYEMLPMFLRLKKSEKFVFVFLLSQSNLFEKKIS
jgi:hypothetical protein